MQVNSKEQMLDVGQILQIAAKNTKSPYPVELLYATFLKEAQMKGKKMLRYGNTIYIIHADPKNPRHGFFRALNADTPDNFIESGFKFVVDAYKAGFDTIITQFTDQSLLNIFRVISRNPPNPQMGFKADKLQNGMYQVTLQLGPRRGVR